MNANGRNVLMVAVVIITATVAFVLVRKSTQSPRPNPVGPVATISNPWPEFSWTPVEEAQYYLIEIEHPSGSVSVHEVWAEAVVLSDPLSLGTYSWRVRARVADDWTGWSRWSEVEQTIRMPVEPYTIVIDGAGNQDMPSICRTDDGGHLIAFRDTAGTAGEEDIGLVRLSHDGTVMWQYHYGGEDHDRPGRRGRSIARLRDGTGFLVSGLTRSFSRTGEFNPWLLMLGNDGEILWQHWFGARYVACARFVAAETLDGDIVAAAVYQSAEDTLSRDVWIVRLDPATGDVVWQ